MFFVNRNYGVSDIEIIIIMFSGLPLVNLIKKSKIVKLRLFVTAHDDVIGAKTHHDRDQ